MKVKELIKKLKELPQEKEIIITSMDDYFSCSDFEIHSFDPETDNKEESLEIILPYYFEKYVKES